MNKQEVPLKELLEECVSMVETLVKQKNLKLITKFDPKLPDIVYTDGNRLKQIILNLCSNAIKFTNDGNLQIAIQKNMKIQVWFFLV